MCVLRKYKACSNNFKIVNIEWLQHNCSNSLIEIRFEHLDRIGLSSVMVTNTWSFGVIGLLTYEKVLNDGQNCYDISQFDIQVSYQVCLPLSSVKEHHRDCREGQGTSKNRQENNDQCCVWKQRQYSCKSSKQMTQCDEHGTNVRMPFRMNTWNSLIYNWLEDVLLQILNCMLKLLRPQPLGLTPP